jgi:hypothetical protein
MKIIEYSSKKLTQEESRYGITEKELLAVLFGLEIFAYELKGRSFILELDHKALEVIRGKIDFGNDRIKRGLEKISEYDFEVKYVKGSMMGKADKLSRLEYKEQQKSRGRTIQNAKFQKHMKAHDGKCFWEFDNGCIVEVPLEADRHNLCWKKHLELGHRSVECVYYDIEKQYYWPDIYETIKSVIQSGETCSINN